MHYTGRNKATNDIKQLTLKRSSTAGRGTTNKKKCNPPVAAYRTCWSSKVNSHSTGQHPACTLPVRWLD